MNPEPDNAPTARSWRDIPQPVKTRAMSRGGRWRRAMSAARTTAVILLAGGIGCGAWVIVASLRESAPGMPAVARTVFVKPPELKTTRDGVLDNAWLARTLALPARVSLMELNLEKLRARVLADGQVLTANFAREFPDRLIVHITERAPVARVRVGKTGRERDLLVDREGFVFAGTGFDPAMIDSLPWLGGLALVPDGAGFRRIARMNLVSQLLADAQFAAGHLYRSWQIVSLARLDSDHEIEVTTRDDATIVFGAKGEFFVQLARLDYIMARRAQQPPSRIRIDLSLGREVPVMFEPLASTLEGNADQPKPVASPFFHAFPSSHTKTKREL